MTGAHALTVLRTRGRRLAKLHRRDGTTAGYDAVRTVDADTFSVADLDALQRLLAGLLHRSDCCVIRGELIEGTRASGIRRLLHPCRQTGAAATFRDVPRCWLALDMEGVELPPDVAAADLAGCARVALGTLPAAFRGAAVIVQASASHGLRPDLRLRLWFMLDRPTWGSELRRWLGDTPADPSVFGAVQPIYTAAPLFENDRDPLPGRLARLDGAPLVVVPPAHTLAPPPRPVAANPILSIQAECRYAQAALESAAGRIALAEKRHPTITREAASLARLVRAGLLDEHTVRAVLTVAARYAGKTDEAELEACIGWGLAQ